MGVWNEERRRRIGEMIDEKIERRIEEEDMDER